MPPTALTYTYTNRTWMDALASAEGIDLRFDDDGDGVVAGDEETNLTTYAINIATAKSNRYLIGRYDPVDLVHSWEVWNWTTIIAVHWACGRRLNPVPQTIVDYYDELIEDMKSVSKGETQLGDVGPRDQTWPAWSNLEIDHRYLKFKLRVQRGISETGGRPQRRYSRWMEHIVEH